MKLESFGISNFKAFGAGVQQIPLKPITLIFGPNSAGKSSALHSLLWMHHAVHQGEIDFRFPDAGGGRVDLGSFSRLLHRSDDKGKCIEVELVIGRGNLPQNLLESLAISKNVTVKLTFGVSARGNQGSPSLIGYGLSIDDHKFLEAVLNGDDRLKVEYLDLLLFQKKATVIDPEWPTAEDIRTIISKFQNSGEDTELDLLLKRIQQAEDLFGKGELQGGAWLPSRMSSGSPWSEEIGSLISAVAVAVTGCFEGLCYVPPLRDLPARYFDLSGADASWQRLFDQPRLLQKINQWLDSDQFRTKYELVVSEYLSRSALEKRLPALLRRIHAGRALDLHVAAADRYDDVASFVAELAPVLGALEKKFNGVDPIGLIQSDYNLRELAAQIAFEMNWGGGDKDTFLSYYGDFTSRSLEEMGEEEGMNFFREHWDVVDFKDMFGPQGYKESANVTDCGVVAFRAWAVRQPELRNLIDRYFDPVEPAELFISHEIKSGGNVRREIVLRDKKHQAEVSLQDVGVGISQVLPVVLHAFGEKGKIIAIEQPEIHIHPALQSELGDVFIESALGENKNTFLLETHSEHLILRLLRRIRETTEGDFSSWSESLKRACPDGIKPEDVAVLYIQPGEEGSEIIELPVTEDGDFSRPWPGGFFAERSKELF